MKGLFHENNSYVFLFIQNLLYQTAQCDDVTVCTVTFKADPPLKQEAILNLKYKIFPLKFIEFGLSILFWAFGILNNIVTSTKGKIDEE